ncbi:hypothetical protein [Alkalicoccobacillus murimartini]|uniref:Uncharacterized protein n=1 Tax=Alkalicoccobacillus murimartini TaxID=171685 RepID=A0ABT9YLC6_9BACI|nr:hypothetical protein [Alkalicoccobacillus murimartini]MDQ0207987.1 hypothetical protein [Alkalicoccobacillus murimartini]
MRHLEFLNDAETADVKRLQRRFVESCDEQLRKRSITQMILIIERARLREQLAETDHCNV